MKCCYGSCMPKPWVLILALLLSNSIAAEPLLVETSRLSQAHEVVCLLAMLKVTCASAEPTDLRWRILFCLYSSDGVVPPLLARTKCIERNT